MRQYDEGVLVVVENYDNLKLLGILTDRDLSLKVLIDRDPERTTVQECMTQRDLICCSPKDDIARVLDTMAEHHVRRVPVIGEGNRVEGIITDRDLLQNGEIDATVLCAALTRITASKVRKPSSSEPMTSLA
jgi:CBS domain-containing protein